MRNKQILCAVFILGFINTYRKIEFYVTEGRDNLGGGAKDVAKNRSWLGNFGLFNCCGLLR